MKKADKLKVIPDPANPNKMADEDKARMEKSLAEFGDLSGVVINRRTGYIIGGHQRVDVLKDAELITEDLPKPEPDGTVARGYLKHGGRKYTVRVVDWPEKKAHAAMLAANRFARVGQDDTQLLKDLLEELDTGELDMDLTGFDEKTIEELMNQFHVEEEQDAEPEIDKAAELNEHWKIKKGDLWLIGEHRLLCGDSTKAEDVRKVMGGEKAGAVITDPPYGQNQKGIPGDEPENLKILITKTVDALPIDNAIAIFFQSPRTFPVLLDACRKSGWKFERMLWLYKTAQCVMPWRGWLLKSEAILVFSKGKPEWVDSHPYAHDCYQVSEVSGELGENCGWHGSCKPIKIVTDLTSRCGGIVLDPFLGSGTTMVACQSLKRKCYGIEISPAYCAVILERMKTAFPDIEIRKA